MSKATNKAKQQAKTKRPVRKPKERRRRNPSMGNHAIFGSIAMGAGILALASIIERIVKVPKPACSHVTPIPCPVDALGIYTNSKCFHFGHIPGMCHECYCLGDRGHFCSPFSGEPCPPDCPNFGKRFDLNRPPDVNAV